MHSSRKSRPPIGGQSRPGQLAALVVLYLPSCRRTCRHQGQAAEKTTIISIGESNNDAQRQELLGYFGADTDAQVEIITVDDTQDAMQEVIPGFSLVTAYSSTALTCLELGEGLDVTTINITQITPAMYAMALVTAGIGDATLIVAAPASAPAQGMTALTGIFKAWDTLSCDSAQTTPKRQEFALRELALTVEISTAIGESHTGYAGSFVIECSATSSNNFTSRDDITRDRAAGSVYGFTVPGPAEAS